MTDPVERPVAATSRVVVVHAVWGVALTLAAWVAFDVVEADEKPRLVPLLVVAILASLEALWRGAEVTRGRAYVAFVGAAAACALLLRFTVGVA